MRLLIVENDLIVTRVWSRYFSRSFEVDIAYQSAEAIELVKKNIPDVVFLDLRLNGPNKTGMEVYNFIRNELKSNTAIFFITGLESGVEVYKQAIIATEKDSNSSYVTQLIKKPVSIKDLSELLESIQKLQHKTE